MTGKSSRRDEERGKWSIHLGRLILREIEEDLPLAEREVVILDHLDAQLNCREGIVNGFIEED